MFPIHGGVGVFPIGNGPDSVGSRRAPSSARGLFGLVGFFLDACSGITKLPLASKSPAAPIFNVLSPSVSAECDGVALALLFLFDFFGFAPPAEAKAPFASKSPPESLCGIAFHAGGGCSVRVLWACLESEGCDFLGRRFGFGVVG